MRTRRPGHRWFDAPGRRYAIALARWAGRKRGEEFALREFFYDAGVACLQAARDGDRCAAAFVGLAQKLFLAGCGPKSRRDPVRRDPVTP